MSHESSLRILAEKLGIATDFWDWKGRHTPVSEHTIVAVMAAMGVDAATGESAEAALAELELKPWRRGLPPVVVVSEGDSAHVEAHVAHGHPAQIRLRLENGEVRYLGQRHHMVEPRDVDGVLIGEASFAIPSDLPTGYHRLELLSDDRQSDSTLIITPRFLGLPANLGDRRIWGYAAQLYSVRSKNSWGIGDFMDLSDLAVWSATQQFSEYVLINPLHAAQPVPPMDVSPYLPSSRLFINPMYLRPEAIPEYAILSQADRDRVSELHQKLDAELAGEQLIDRDTSWRFKREALRIIYQAGLRSARQMAFDDFKRRQGRALRDFVLWCVLCEHYGNDWRLWDEDLRRPSSPRVARLRNDYLDEITFNEWLQWISWTQLSDAQQAAQDAGMSVGIITDLAVGVSGASADTWMMRDVYAQDISVGAPPDGYNQMGQDWGQPPWRPDRLADTAYAPFRSMLQTALGHAGGVRIDHILGMFRLWWIPEGGSPREGTYVRYDHDALVGIIMLEAQRAGAFVIGEDLGTVEPWVRGYLAERGILGTSVLWFEHDQDGNPAPADRWREYVMASVTTHDLPPTAGYLDKEHVRLRHELGLLTESYEKEEADAEREQEAWIGRLDERGLFTDDVDDDTEAKVLALYRYLTITDAKVLNVALVDAVGDYRIQNQPGTWREYPNWQIPLSGPHGEPITLEDLYRMERPMRLASVLNGYSWVPSPFGSDGR
ncbi:4-alpha-glucanotransferase [Propionimicrobium sp. PCR01-08-3]|uniref:4-alpha-glucanotransferase n=1 Tax=Propionimicrobium sp. PCR01-08-3 TaxID=3052086 RepID=UPI00255CAB3A|nr:4-alpha-glucanotransferase [Propionimicrobium sp. PCR01-08-3]WIY83331.1 4-alpha-glucanotransferase [Propionimicrobium sp. PCR01-08-3]